MPDLLRILLAVALALPTVYLSVVALYLALLGVGAWRFRVRALPLAGEPPRFALLIPAHNESGQIANVVKDALSQDYPPERRMVFVIADNCTDDTAARAREAGASVFERNDPSLRGKGQALDWCLREQRATLEQYDLIALVDADMIIDRRFLAELAQSFSEEGVEVVQSLNTVANPDASWRAAFGYMGFTTINFTRPAGRVWLGGTAELRGSGMAFRAPLLLRYGWPAHSIAEDIEFSKQLLLDGVRIGFNPRAKVMSDIPLQARQANVQQRRWEGGKLHIVKTYLPEALRRAAARPSVAHVDAVLDMLVPPQSVLFLLLAATLIGASLVHPAWALWIAACGGMVAFCIITGLLLQRAPLKVWLYLLALPAFLAWKVPLYAGLLLRRGGQGWNRTPRDAEL